MAAHIAAIVADVVFDRTLPDEDRALATVRRFLTMPRPLLHDHLADIHAKGPSYGFGFAAQIAGNLKGITEKQIDGFYGQAGTAIARLFVPSLAAVVSAGTPTTFRTRELRSGKLDIFLCIDLGTYNDFPELARLVTGSFLNELYLAKGQVARRTLFLVDEAARLGYRHMLEDARDAGRGFQINPMHVPDVRADGRLRQVGRAPLDGCRRDQGLLFDRRSRQRRDHFPAVRRVHRALARHQHLVRLLPRRGRSPHDPPGGNVTPRGGEPLILVKGQPHIRCGKAFWFRRPGMKATLDARSFEQGCT
ncbi:type IV secretory pathway TraG/TraD family ATPase VirD4 [Aureimonas pseudogalii]|uniref:Type IV secretory pathway TraG/TraD family ATPase VirD4 n=1 Tax=Aureimonas pseudogalii TaxID=1744844 RepID=A0A7W6MMF4_9HYPH|nr:type IV secretory system conjugative DNA transfer family protein [Aureimonas pseudogalii]MBB4000800.1 type IV secretory pathway TraG/TraD family ATPase VirD4 [Aureimonas pseudogalii]